MSCFCVSVEHIGCASDSKGAINNTLVFFPLVLFFLNTPENPLHCVAHVFFQVIVFSICNFLIHTEERWT